MEWIFLGDYYIMSGGGYYKRKVIAKKPKYKYKYYKLKGGNEVTDKNLIDKLNEIKIPGTYTNVIVTPDPKNGLEGTGYDGTGRKQYFYSKKHLEDARKEKYSNLIFLGMNLKDINRDIEKLTKKRNPDLDCLNAMALQIMLMCNFRVGSQNNQKKYGTYGLSTLTTEHVTFKNGGAVIKFNGKKQQLNECFIKDKDVVNMLRKLVNHNKVSGSSNKRGGGSKSAEDSSKYLFSWNGDRLSPDSLNEFLGKYHPDITTKTWRTWFANIRYLDLMKAEKENPESKTARKRLSNQVVKKVAEELHHTAAICKKNYLMTELTDLYVEKPERWRLGKSQTSDQFFTNFLKSHYSISKDWIRKRSRSRERSRTRSRTGGALGGPTWKPELAAHEPGYTGRLALSNKIGGGKKKDTLGTRKNSSKSRSKGPSRSIEDDSSSSEDSYSSSYSYSSSSSDDC